MLIQQSLNTNIIPILLKRALGHRVTEPDHGYARTQGLADCAQTQVPDLLVILAPQGKRGGLSVEDAPLSLKPRSKEPLKGSPQLQTHHPRPFLN